MTPNLTAKITINGTSTAESTTLAIAWPIIRSMIGRTP